MLESVWVQCPYCGETFETVVDTSQGSTQYVEDCAVCCQPIVLTLEITDGNIERVLLERENQ